MALILFSDGDDDDDDAKGCKCHRYVTLILFSDGDDDDDAKGVSVTYL